MWRMDNAIASDLKKLIRKYSNIWFILIFFLVFKFLLNQPSLDINKISKKGSALHAAI